MLGKDTSNVELVIYWNARNCISMQENVMSTCFEDVSAVTGFLKLFRMEPRHEKTHILHMQKQRRRCEADQRLNVFATRIVQSLCFLNQKYPTSNRLLCRRLCSSVCVGPFRKPHCWFFSCRGSDG